MASWSESNHTVVTFWSPVTHLPSCLIPAFVICQPKQSRILENMQVIILPTDEFADESADASESLVCY